jgi:hypothetical protein
MRSEEEGQVGQARRRWRDVVVGATDPPVGESINVARSATVKNPTLMKLKKTEEGTKSVGALLFRSSSKTRLTICFQYITEYYKNFVIGKAS